MPTISDLLADKMPHKTKINHKAAWIFLKNTFGNLDTTALTAANLESELDKQYHNLETKSKTEKCGFVAGVLASIGITNLGIKFDKDTEKFKVTPKIEGLAAPGQARDSMQQSGPSGTEASTVQTVDKMLECIETKPRSLDNAVRKGMITFAQGLKITDL